MPPQGWWLVFQLGKEVMERLGWWRKQGGESRPNSLGFHKSDKMRLEKCMLAMWLCSSLNVYGPHIKNEESPWDLP